MHWFAVFFFKQNTAYEMRISDWSSDVCSSDLVRHPAVAGLDIAVGELAHQPADRRLVAEIGVDAAGVQRLQRGVRALELVDLGVGQIGRAACRERVCQYV